MFFFFGLIGNVKDVVRAEKSKLDFFIAVILFLFTKSPVGANMIIILRMPDREQNFVPENIFPTQGGD